MEVEDPLDLPLLVLVLFLVLGGVEHLERRLEERSTSFPAPVQVDRGDADELTANAGTTQP